MRRQNNNRNRRLVRRRPKGQSNLTLGNINEKVVTVSVPKNRLGTPDRMLVWLAFTDPVFQRSPGGFPSQNWRYRTSARDIDPLVATTAMPLFTEWIAIFEKCRILKCMYEITLVNNETFPVLGSISWLTSDPGSNSQTALQIIEISGSRFAKNFCLGQTSGQNRMTLKMTTNMIDVYGDPAYLYEDLACCSVSNNPAVMNFLNIGATTSGGGNFTTGLTAMIRLKFLCEFTRPTIIYT
jgi:hypothetical protein